LIVRRQIIPPQDAAARNDYGAATSAVRRWVGYRAVQRSVSRGGPGSL